MIRHYLGIDGGGTKTAFRLETDGEAGRVSRELTLGPGNPNDIGMDACLSLLGNGIREICNGMDPSELSVFAGIAGYASGDNGEKIKAYLRRFDFGVLGCGSDMENALALARKRAGDEVVAVIAGTGSVAYSLHNGKRKMTGGLGYLLDSVGSAYFIGREALTAALKEMDGRGEATGLTALCEAKLGMPLGASIAAIYRGGKAYIASFAPLVFEAARAGDAPALDILDRNGKGMAELISAALRAFEGKEAPVVISGGLCHEKELLDQSIRRYLGQSQPIFYTSEPMVCGCIFLAEEQARETPF